LNLASNLVAYELEGCIWTVNRKFNAFIADQSCKGSRSRSSWVDCELWRINESMNLERKRYDFSGTVSASNVLGARLEKDVQRKVSSVVRVWRGFPASEKLD
jgi:hypothetical protein